MKSFEPRHAVSHQTRRGPPAQPRRIPEKHKPTKRTGGEPAARMPSSLDGETFRWLHLQGGARAETESRNCLFRGRVLVKISYEERLRCTSTTSGWFWTASEFKVARSLAKEQRNAVWALPRSRRYSGPSRASRLAVASAHARLSHSLQWDSPVEGQSVRYREAAGAAIGRGGAVSAGTSREVRRSPGDSARSKAQEV